MIIFSSANFEGSKSCFPSAPHVQKFARHLSTKTGVADPGERIEDGRGNN